MAQHFGNRRKKGGSPKEPEVPITQAIRRLGALPCDIEKLDKNLPKNRKERKRIEESMRSYHRFMEEQAGEKIQRLTIPEDSLESAVEDRHYLCELDMSGRVYASSRDAHEVIRKILDRGVVYSAEEIIKKPGNAPTEFFQLFGIIRTALEGYGRENDIGDIMGNEFKMAKMIWQIARGFTELIEVERSSNGVLGITGLADGLLSNGVLQKDIGGTRFTYSEKDSVALQKIAHLFENLAEYYSRPDVLASIQFE